MHAITVVTKNAKGQEGWTRQANTFTTWKRAKRNERRLLADRHKARVVAI